MAKEMFFGVVINTTSSPRLLGQHAPTYTRTDIFMGCFMAITCIVCVLAIVGIVLDYRGKKELSKRFCMPLKIYMASLVSLIAICFLFSLLK